MFTIINQHSINKNKVFILKNLIFKMSNLHFTPKSAKKAPVNFKPKGAIKKNQTITTTVRKNYFGDIEKKFPPGHKQLIYDAAKLINNYVVDEKDKHQLQKENSALIQNPQTQEKKLKIYANQTSVNKTSNLFPTNDLVNSSENVSIAEEEAPEIIDRKMVHLIGSVENVMRWSQILKNAEISVLYNVLGTFIKVLNGIHLMEKYVFIKGNNGTVLECNYFEVDRPFPQISKGQFIGCLGQMYDAKKLKLYGIQLLDDSQRTETQRAVFLSQRMVHELNNEKQYS